MFWTFLQHWLAIHTGTTIPGTPHVNEYYNFWSGFGSDFGEFSIFAALFAFLYKHNCHEKRCWRIARHVVDGSPWCNRHQEKARKAYSERQRTPE